jgi:hypothetical protein
MNICIRPFLFLIPLFAAFASPAQLTQPGEQDRPARKWILPVSASAVAAGSLVGLNELWYAQYERTSLRSFNDNSEWLQMDKIGHGFTCYQVSYGLYDAAIGLNYSHRSSMCASALSTLGYMTVIELLDGHSEGWGFSWGDMAANAGGVSLFAAQQIGWKEQRVQLKFSYSHSEFATVNPSLLGRNFQQRLIKDYNAQTHWCSANISRFLASDADFPKWLNIAFGYGATGMTRAVMNENDVNNFRRAREYYFSFDADLNRVQWPRKWMKKVARVISFIKLPAPTLEVQSDGKVKVYALFF